MSCPADAAGVRFSVALLSLLAFAGAGAVAAAHDATPLPAPPPADCSLVPAVDASRILGYPVADADESSRAGGICFYPSRVVSDEGSLTYAVVTEALLPERRAYFSALAVRCGSVSHGAPREFVCGLYIKLARAKDLDEYFAARTSLGEPSPVPGLGASAVATEEALYLRRPDSVIEIVVKRGDQLDLGRSTELAKLLLARLNKR